MREGTAHCAVGIRCVLGPWQILRRAVAVAIEISAIEDSSLLGNLLIPQR
jgi:hypothetical protein